MKFCFIISSLRSDGNGSNFFFIVKVSLICSVVLVSSIQQSDSALRVRVRGCEPVRC